MFAAGPFARGNTQCNYCLPVVKGEKQNYLRISAFDGKHKHLFKYCSRKQQLRNLISYLCTLFIVKVKSNWNCNWLTVVPCVNQANVLLRQ